MNTLLSLRLILFAVLTTGVCLSSCTLYRAADRFEYSRQGDSLTVQLSPRGQARWDPNFDSLLIVCSNCEASSASLVEHFEDNAAAVYTIDPQADLTLRMTYMGRTDTVNLPGTADTNTGTAVHRIPRRPRRSAATQTKEPTPTPQKTAEKPPEKPAEKPAKPAVKTARSVKVIAPEGVAVYKDKSKTEVLKILPAGSTIALLAREGDLYSVAVDGQEGFVEAEAVQVNE